MEETTIDQWLDWLRHDRGRAENTLRSYTKTMRTIPDAENATREDIERWWRSRAVDEDGNQRPHSSRNNELSAVRSYYRWAVRFDHRKDDPTVRIDNLRRQSRVSRFIGREDLHLLLSTLPPDLRRAVALGAYGGMRVGEAACLSWADVNVEARLIIIRGKGDQERTIRASATLLDVLLPDTGGNVVTGRAEPYGENYLQTKVNAAMRAAGVSGTFHKLRHRYGYMCAEAGIAPTSIARAMGHKSLQTTMGYIAAMDSDLDLIAEAVTR